MSQIHPHTTNPQPSTLIPGLRTALHKASAHHSTRNAGHILSSFCFLTTYIASHRFQSLDEALPACHWVWSQILANRRLSEQVRKALENVNLARTVAGICVAIEYIRNSPECDGQTFRFQAGKMATVAGLIFLQSSEEEVEEILSYFAGVVELCGNAAEMSISSESGEHAEVADGESVCPICWNAFGGVQVMMKVCGHEFCEDCIVAWMNELGQANRHKCPVCRADLAVVGV